MILRTAASRHGRRALATPLQKSCTRSLSQLETTDSAVAPPWGALQSQANAGPLEEAPQPRLNRKGRVPPIAHEHNLFRRTQKRSGKWGTEVEPFYKPVDLIARPPAPKDVTLELLMASQSHMGHNTSLWNPANQRYIFGVRQGIHIISLEVTAAHLRRAAKIVEGVAYHGGLILFIGTRPGQSLAVVRAAELAKGCHLFERWTPGTITNGDQILSGRLQVVDHNDQPLSGYEHQMLEYNALKPDLVVCLNPLENYIALHECGLNNIPTIGIIDTDADPTWVTYPIPANDDSLRCTQLIAGVLGRAGEEGQRKRLEAAKQGVVTWQPPVALRDPPKKEELEAGEAAARARDEETLLLGRQGIPIGNYSIEGVGMGR